MMVHYREGGEADDPLFDRPLLEQYAYVANAMGLAPDEKTWPIDTLDQLLYIRASEGVPRYFVQMMRMISPRCL